MNEPAPTRPIPRRRFATWLVTGPPGRFVGFVLDLAAELLRAAGRGSGGRTSR